MHDSVAEALYFPLAQFVHAEFSSPVAKSIKNLPAAQLEQLAEADPLYWPVPQLEQAEDSAPVASSMRYLPAAQLEQLSEADPL